MNPYDDQSVSAGEIADYLHATAAVERPVPDLHLIAPPLTAGTSCIIREAGERQTWERVTLDAHQLDYYDLADLWPGWCCWHHNGRYISDNTLRYLTSLMWTPHSQP